MSATTKTRKVALFREQKFDFVTAFDMDIDQDDRSLGDYLRISEWQVVEFELLSPATLAGVELTALAELREKTVAEFTQKLNFIDGRIANCRALTGPVTP